MSIEQAMTEGIVFRGAPSEKRGKPGVKNKGQEESLYHRLSRLRLGQDEGGVSPSPGEQA